MSDDLYEVYALAYARVERRSPENFLGGDLHDVPMPLSYYVWLIVGGGKTIVVDTGFDQRGADLRKREITKPVGRALTEFGVDLEAVEDVIITHLHYDHCGNDGLFPKARYHLQEAEMAYATGRCMCHQVLQKSFEVEDVVAMVRRVYAGRVAFHEGAAEIAPGVSLHHIGGHSRGLQAVRVRTRRGWVVLASDVVHFYAHLDRRVPYPVIDNVPAMLEGFDTVERLASSRDHVVPGHDPIVQAIYPAARPGTEGWAVRLDAEPKPR